MKSLFRLFFIMIIAPAVLITPVSSQSNDARSETVAWPFVRNTLDPSSYHDPLDILHLMCEGLVGYDPTTGLVPLLAVSWDISDDGLTYTFHLRQDVKFHNNDSLVANDVAFSFSRIADQTMPKIEVVDDYTVQATLTAPTPSFLARLPGYFIVSNKAADAGVDFATNPTCTGPYKVSQWSPNEVLNLDAHTAYWGGTPPYDSLIFRILPDLEVRRLAFQNSEIDAALIPYDELPDLVNYPSGQLRITDDLSTRLFVYNLNDPVTGNTLIRQALSLAIDREQIVNTLFQGNLKAAQGFYPPYQLSFEGSGSTYDPEAAKSLLDQAGYVDRDGDGLRDFPDGSALQLEILTLESSIQLQILQVIQKQFADIGIKLTINATDNSTYLQKLSDCKMQIALISSTIQYADLDGGLRGLFENLKNCGYLGDSTSKIIGLLNDASSMPFAGADQLGRYREADRVAVNDQGVLTPIYYGGLGLYLQPNLPEPRSSIWSCRYLKRC